MRDIVDVEEARGWNMSLFGSPKWTIKCGYCEVVFKKRLPKIDEPVVICPHCGTRNRLRFLTCGKLTDEM
jgi:uncharacterized Zn-finger protein